MGKAIILQDSDFSVYGLGVVTRVTLQILPYVSTIQEATTFRAEKDGVQIAGINWSISDGALASIVTNLDGTCEVTPLVSGNTSPVTLTASDGLDTTSISFIPSIPTYTWYIDRCTLSPSSGYLQTPNLQGGGWAYMPYDNALFRGKRINRIAFIPSQQGSFKIQKTTALDGVMTTVDTIEIQSNDIGAKTIYEISEFTLGMNEYLVFGEANSQGGMKFLGGSSQQNGLYTRVPSNPTPSSEAAVGTPGQSTVDLFISVGYYGAFSK